MQIDHTAFFNGYRAAYGKLPQAVISGIELLGRNMEADPALRNLQWAAYMLATVKHECANTWQPITERGPEGVLRQVRDRHGARPASGQYPSRAMAGASAGAAMFKSPAAPITHG